MKKESLGLRPDTNAGTIKTSKFIDSTSYIYNRHTHDNVANLDAISFSLFRFLTN